MTGRHLIEVEPRGGELLCPLHSVIDDRCYLICIINRRYCKRRRGAVAHGVATAAGRGEEWFRNQQRPAVTWMR